MLSDSCTSIHMCRSIFDHCVGARIPIWSLYYICLHLCIVKIILNSDIHYDRSFKMNQDSKRWVDDSRGVWLIIVAMWQSFLEFRQCPKISLVNRAKKTVVCLEMDSYNRKLWSRFRLVHHLIKWSCMLRWITKWLLVCVITLCLWASLIFFFFFK